jgi:heat-inducible transcriptional repressor
MLALVSAPQLQATSVRHVEIVLLNPRTVMAVVITSTGGVAKRVVAFDHQVDAGLAQWAREYLNERLAGLRLGTSAVRRALEEPSLSAAERRFVAALGGVFTDLMQSEQRLYLGGAAELLEGAREDELDLYRHVLITLERRAALLELLGEALDPLRTWVRVGGELDHPALQDAALVGATYGLTNRALGAVGLLGPVRMDYEKAIRSVRGAAQELSASSKTCTRTTEHGARLLRAPRRRTRCERRRHQARVSPARPGAAPRRLRGAGCGAALSRGRRGV